MGRREFIGILSRAVLRAGVSSSLLAISTALASPPLPLSVLVLDESASLRPWSTAIIKAIQSSMRGNFAKPISYYVEHLDLYDFYSPRYEDNLRSILVTNIATNRLPLSYPSDQTHLSLLSNCALLYGRLARRIYGCR
jgi:hypothetical protein